MPGGCIDANGILQGAGRGGQGQSASCDGGRQQGPHCANGIFVGLLCGTDKYLLYLFLLHNEPIVVTLR